MATPTQGFRRRVKDRLVKERPVTHFFLESYDEDEEGNEIITRHDDFHARTPTEEQLMLAFALGGREESTTGDQSAAILSLLKDVLPDGEYKTLIKRFRDADDLDVDSESLMEIFTFLMEQWQDFPTSQPSVSSGSRAGSGGRSTGRARGKGSTR